MAGSCKTFSPTHSTILWLILWFYDSMKSWNEKAWCAETLLSCRALAQSWRAHRHPACSSVGRGQQHTLECLYWHSGMFSLCVEDSILVWGFLFGSPSITHLYSNVTWLRGLLLLTESGHGLLFQSIQHHLVDNLEHTQMVLPSSYYTCSKISANNYLFPLLAL